MFPFFYENPLWLDICWAIVAALHVQQMDVSSGKIYVMPNVAAAKYFKLAEVLQSKIRTWRESRSVELW